LKKPSSLRILREDGFWFIMSCTKTFHILSCVIAILVAFLVSALLLGSASIVFHKEQILHRKGVSRAIREDKKSGINLAKVRIQDFYGVGVGLLERRAMPRMPFTNPLAGIRQIWCLNLSAI
jgi:hypothetical protein